MKSVLDEVLELARWAPSGDNTQPWRFEVVADDTIVVHGFDTREHCVYDLSGHASQVAIGGLLETLRIAATAFGRRAIATRLVAPDDRPTFEVKLIPDARLAPSSLIAYIKTRTVQRRAMSLRPLTPSEKGELETSVGGDFRVVWLEGWRRRLAAARLTFANAKIRLTMREAFEVHRKVIEWDSRFSSDRIPDRAIGLDPVTMRAMRWAMQDWRRIEFLNTYLAGTLTPRMELDFIPGLACAAHFLLVAGVKPITVDDYVAAGGAMQRFWLTATQLGLHVQPQMTPLIFYGYVHEGRQFSTDPGLWEAAKQLAHRFDALLGPENVTRGVFFGRIGGGRGAVSRSLRRSLDELMVQTSPKSGHS
jgi:nitroreductase